MRELESYIGKLIIGQGRYAGQPFTLLPFQRRFLRGTFKQADDSALSCGRGLGKTTFTASIAAATIDGPLMEPMAETLVIASSFEQGLIAFRHIKHFLTPTIEKDPRRYRSVESSNRAMIQDKRTGAIIRVLGSDPRRLHGAAPRLILADEVAQWPPSLIDRMLAALTTSRGKIPDSRMLYLGTRAASPTHPYELALNSVGYSQVHAAKESDPPFQQRTWRKSFPSLAHFPDLLATLKREAAAARRDPAALQAFKALRLNLGVGDAAESILVSAEVWASIEGDAPAEGRSCWGVDLGAGNAMSAIASYWPESRRLDCVAAFPELPTLAERGLSDGVGGTYVTMQTRGELLTLGRRISDIPALLKEALKRFGTPDLIVCDRWREAELRQALESIGFPLTGLVVRGQGYRDGSEDVRDFRAAALSDSVVPVKSLLLRAAVSEARTIADPAGNEKLAKSTEGGRRMRAKDDSAAAAILAIAEGSRRRKALSGGRKVRYLVAG